MFSRSNAIVCNNKKYVLSVGLKSNKLKHTHTFIITLRPTQAKQIGRVITIIFIINSSTVKGSKLCCLLQLIYSGYSCKQGWFFTPCSSDPGLR